MAALLLLSAACGGGGRPAATPTRTAPPATVTPSATPTPTPTPTGPAVPATLSGRAGAAGPVLAVKVDNTEPAHPQAGLAAADVVYVEQVEGGLTRLLAVFSTTVPPLVGPVRSARESDLELLAQYGRVGFAFSGANTGVLAEVQAAPVLAMAGGPGFARAGNRRAPYNLMADPRVLVGRAAGAALPGDVGLRYGPLPAGGQPAAGATATWPGARLQWRWSPEGRWLLSMDGRPDLAAEGGQLGPTTLVVQYVDVVPSRYADVNGQVTPYTKTVGSGPVLVYRDGQVLPGTWSRPAPGAPTRYLGPGGTDLLLAPGQVWVVLLDKARPVTPG